MLTFGYSWMRAILIFDGIVEEYMFYRSLKYLTTAGTIARLLSS